jgi:hypothetical protein
MPPSSIASPLAIGSASRRPPSPEKFVTPPAGAVGRGDAFILKIAARIDAVVLSNDSFQEYHDEHPWLFDIGRLIGGKPVPGVGWISLSACPFEGLSRLAL